MPDIPLSVSLDTKPAVRPAKDFTRVAGTAGRSVDVLQKSLSDTSRTATRASRSLGDTGRTLTHVAKGTATAAKGFGRLRAAQGGFIAGTGKATAAARAGTAANAAYGKSFGALSASMAGSTKNLLAFAAGFVTVRAGAAELSNTVQAFASFESSMAAVEAVTGGLPDEMQRMAAVARELGETTQFSASQAASGMEFLGRAGFNTTQIISAMPSVLSLAAAASLDLGQAADITSNIMSAFGVAAEDTARIADALAMVAASANTDVSGMGDAMKLVGPVANALGLSMEKTSAAVGILANAGIQATMAGTGLRQVLGSLAGPTDKAAGIIRSMGLTLEEVNPATNEFVDIVRRLEQAGLDAGQAIEIFDTRGAPAILALTSQAESLALLTQQMQDTGGTAADMAGIMQDTLTGAGNRIQSAMEGLRITLGEQLEPVLRTTGEELATFLRESQVDAVAMGRALADGIKTAVDAIKFLAENFQTLQTVAIATGTALAVLKFGPMITGAAAYASSLVALEMTLGGVGVASGIAAAGTKALTVAMMANPFLLVAAAVAALVAGVYALNNAIKETSADYQSEIDAMVDSTNAFQARLDKFGAQADKAITSNNIQAMSDALAEQSNALEEAEKRFAAASAEVEHLQRVEKGLANDTRNLKDAQAEALQEYNLANRELGKLETSTDALKDAMRAWTPEIESAEDKTSDLSKRLKAAQSAFADLAKEIGAPIEQLQLTKRLMEEFGAGAEVAADVAERILSIDADLTAGQMQALVNQATAAIDKTAQLAAEIDKLVSGKKVITLEVHVKKLAEPPLRDGPQLQELPVLGPQAGMEVEKVTDVAAENAERMAGAFRDAGQEMQAMAAHMEGAAATGAQLVGVGLDIGGAFKQMKIAKKSGDKEAIATATENFGSAVESAVISGLAVVAKSISGGGTSQFGGAQKRNFAAEGMQLGSSFGPAGAFAGLVVGGLIEEDADEAVIQFTQTIDDFSASVVKAEGGLKGFAAEFAGASNAIVAELQMLLTGFDLGSLGAEFQVQGDRINVTVAGLKKGFDNVNDALGFVLEKALHFNRELAAEGTNVRRLLETVGGREELGGLDNLQAGLAAAQALDDMVSGIDAKAVEDIRAARMENEQFMATVRQYGLSMQDAIAFTNARIQAELDGIKALQQSFFGVQDFTKEILKITEGMTAANSELDKAAVSRAARIDVLQKSITAMESATAEADGSVAGAIANIGNGLVDGVQQGAQDAAQGAAEAGQQLGQNVLGGLRDELMGGGGGIGGRTGGGGGIPELGGGGELGEFRTEFGDTMYEVGQGAASLEQLREELAALQDEANALPDAFDLQEIIDTWTAGASKAGLALIDILQSIRGESFLAQEQQELQNNLVKLQLAGQIASLQALLAMTDLLSDATRATLESIGEAALDTLNKLESGEISLENVAASGAGQRKQMRADVQRTFEELAINARTGSTAVGSFAAQIDGFAETLKDARKLGVDATNATRDFATVMQREILAPFEDVGLTGEQTALRDIEQARLEAIEKLDLLGEVMRANGQDATDLASAYEKVEKATQQQIQELGMDFIASMQSMGASLPIAQTEALARAQFEATRMSMLRTAAELEAAGAFANSALTIEQINEALRAMRFESLALRGALELGRPERTRTQTQLAQGRDVREAGIEAAGAFGEEREGVLVTRINRQWERFLENVALSLEEEATSVTDKATGLEGTAREVLNVVDAGAALRADSMELRKEYVALGKDTTALDKTLANVARGTAMAVDEIALAFIPSLEQFGVALNPEQMQEVANLEFELARMRTLAALATLKANDALAGLSINFDEWIQIVANATPPLVEVGDAVNGLSASVSSSSRALSTAAERVTGLDQLLDSIRSFIDGINAVDLGPFTQMSNDFLQSITGFEQDFAQEMDKVVDGYSVEERALKVARLGLGDLGLKSLADLTEEQLQILAAMDISGIQGFREGMEDVFDIMLAMGEAKALRPQVVDQILNAFEETLTPASGLQGEFDALVASMLDAQQALMDLDASAESMERLAVLQAQAMDVFWANATAPLQGLLDQMSATDPRRGAEETFRLAQEDFRELAARARAGDLSAVDELRKAGEALLASGADFLGEGIGSLDFLDEVRNTLEAVIGQGPPTIEIDPVAEAVTNGNAGIMASVDAGNAVLTDILSTLEGRAPGDVAGLQGATLGPPAVLPQVDLSREPLREERAVIREITRVDDGQAEIMRQMLRLQQERDRRDRRDREEDQRRGTVRNRAELDQRGRMIGLLEQVVEELRRDGGTVGAAS